MFGTQFTVERLIRIHQGAGSAEDLAPHVISRLAAGIQESGGVYKGGRAENGLCVLEAEMEDKDYVIVCGVDATNEDIVVRVLANDRFPAYVAVGTFIAVMLVTLIASFSSGLSDKQPLVSFVLAVLVSFLASYGAFTLAAFLRSRNKSDVEGVQMNRAQAILNSLEKGLENLDVDVIDEKGRILGVDVSPESHGPVDDSTVEMRTQSVLWTKIFQSALAAVPVD